MGHLYLCSYSQAFFNSGVKTAKFNHVANWGFCGLYIGGFDMLTQFDHVDNRGCPLLSMVFDTLYYMANPAITHSEVHNEALHDSYSVTRYLPNGVTCSGGHRLFSNLIQFP